MLDMHNQKAVFGAGCFWHVEDVFRKVKGVKATSVGYMGGKKKNPTYKDVHSANSRHVEVVALEYDSEKVSFSELLDVFWSIHDPTSLDRQGADIGPQYKSVIFYQNKNQYKDALESLKSAQEKHVKKIVTEILPAKEFHRAEEHHQQFLEKKKLCSCGFF
jgi:peptide-methionine (S)-S-oxide reductase